VFIKCSLFRITQAFTVLYIEIVIIYLYSAKLWAEKVLSLRCLSNSLMSFLVHVRMLDHKLLPLSVTWVPTVSRP